MLGSVVTPWHWHGLNSSIIGRIPAADSIVDNSMGETGQLLFRMEPTMDKTCASRIFSSRNADSGGIGYPAPLPKTMSAADPARTANLHGPHRRAHQRTHVSEAICTCRTRGCCGSLGGRPDRSSSPYLDRTSQSHPRPSTKHDEHASQWPCVFCGKFRQEPDTALFATTLCRHLPARRTWLPA